MRYYVVSDIHGYYTQMKSALKKIIPAMLDYFETEHYVFTHAWVPSILNRDKSYSYIMNVHQSDCNETKDR